MSGLTILERQLGTMLGRSSSKREPGRYVAIKGADRAPVRKVRGLWTVEIGGRAYSNSHLRDLKHQLAGLHYDMLAEQS